MEKRSYQQWLNFKGVKMETTTIYIIVAIFVLSFILGVIISIYNAKRMAAYYKALSKSVFQEEKERE